MGSGTGSLFILQIQGLSMLQHHRSRDEKHGSITFVQAMTDLFLHPIERVQHPIADKKKLMTIHYILKYKETR